LIVNEENYNKILHDNESLKKEILNLINTIKYSNNIAITTTHEPKILTPPNIKSFSSGKSLVYKEETSDSYRINSEYLKNVLLKYLEAIAIGNEFQIKILENVLFTILNVTKNEINKLEEKRAKSSFYYNLWYNAKSFLAARIYGGPGESDNSIRMNESLSSSFDDLDIVRKRENDIDVKKLNEI
jgi:hypothetical protein